MTFCCISYSSSAVEMPLGDPFMDITSFQVTGNFGLGDTVHVLANFRALVDANVYIGVKFSQYLTPIDFQTSALYYELPMLLDSGQVYNRDYRFIVNSVGISNLSFYGVLGDNADLYNFADRIESVSTVYHSEFAFAIEALDGIDDPHNFLTEDLNPNWGGSGSQKIINLSGTVRSERYQLGGFNVVRLYFYNPDDCLGNCYEDVYHPIPLTNGEYIEHTHYAVCDENGNFSFNFTFNKTWPVGTQLMLVVCKSNEAIEKLESPQGHNVLYLDNPASTVLWTYPNAIYTYNLGTQNNINPPSIRLNIAEDDIKTFRYITLCRKFVKDRFGVADYENLPFNQSDPNGNLPPVNVKFVAKGLNVAKAAYTNAKEITVSIDNPDVWCLSKAYGRYLHDAFDGDISYNYGLNFDQQSAWSTFFYFCVYNYIQGHSSYYESNLFTDYYWCDNLEAAPYIKMRQWGQQTPITRFGNYYSIFDFSNAPPYACYLWNIYDGCAASTFESDKQFFDHDHQQDVGDNDDVPGKGQELFEVFAESSSETLAEFNNDLQNYLDDTALNQSVQQIYDFMTYGNWETEMPKPAQIKDLNWVQNIPYNSLSLTWYSQSYQTAATPQSLGWRRTIKLKINDQDVNTNFIMEGNFKNVETGYKIHYVGEPDITVNYVNIHNYLYSIVVGGAEAQGEWCVSAYNASGESYLSLCKSKFGKYSAEEDILINLFSFEVASQNPFADYARLKYNLPENCHVKLEVYDETNRLVTSLLNQSIAAGEHEITFDSYSLSSGVYFCRMIATGNSGNGYAAIKKLLVIK